jgi:hypothetical protein
MLGEIKAQLESLNGQLAYSLNAAADSNLEGWERKEYKAVADSLVSEIEIKSNTIEYLDGVGR